VLVVALVVVLAPPTLPSVEFAVDALVLELTVALALVCTAVIVGPVALVCVTLALVPPIPPWGAGAAGSAEFEHPSARTASAGVAKSSLSHMSPSQWQPTEPGGSHFHVWHAFARVCERYRANRRDTRSSSATLQWRIK